MNVNERDGIGGKHEFYSLLQQNDRLTAMYDCWNLREMRDGGEITSTLSWTLFLIKMLVCGLSP